MTARCPVCHRRQRLTPAGVLVPHLSGSRQCSGSGTDPSTPLADTIEMYVRKPGAPGEDRSVTVRWPAQVRVPVIGELLTMPDGEQHMVRAVQWWIDDPEATPKMGRVQVQVIV